MTDEIRKLLGGYATNTLTETERKTLFEAALDDQELFDALQKEQALRDLLDDPVSRTQIRQALDKQAPLPWWSRWWTWTAAASAVAAAVLVVAVTRTHAPEPIRHYAAVQSAKPVPASPPSKVENDAELRPPARGRATPLSAHSASKQMVQTRPALAENERKDENQPAPAPAAPPPPLAVPAPQQQVQLDAQSNTVTGAPSQNRSSETQAQNQQAVAGAISDRSQLDTFSTNALRAVVTSVRYTLLKRDANGADQPLSPDTGLNAGDAVRIRVVPTTSGYLILSRQNAAGQLVRVFPETGPGLSVAANGNYIIPGSAIEVTPNDQRFRLTLIPASMMEVGALGQLKAKTGALKKEANPNPPFFVDVVIGPAVR